MTNFARKLNKNTKKMVVNKRKKMLNLYRKKYEGMERLVKVKS